MPRIDGQNLSLEAPLGTPIAMLRTPTAPLAGVQITAAGARNLCGVGPGGGLVSHLGVGQLTLTDAGLLSWRAPGAGASGTAQDVTAGGAFTLQGLDPDAWLAVDVDETFLQHGVAWVELEPTFGNGVASSDITNLSVPPTDTFAVVLKNNSASTMSNLTAWMDQSVWENRWVSLKFGAGAYAQTWNESDALSAHGAQTINAGANLTLTVKRLAVAPTAHWRRVVRIRISWDDGVGGRAYSEAIALYRCRGSAQYEGFQGTTEPDPEHDAAAATGAALPLTITAAITNGEYHHAAILRNAYGLGGGLQDIQRVTVAAGVQGTNAPDGDLDVRLEPRAGGVTRVHSRFGMPQETDRRPIEWALWYTTNGSTPGSGSPNVTATLTRARRSAVWQYDLPAQADGTVVKVLVKVRKAGPVYQVSGTSANLTIRTTGPLAPASGGALGSGR